MKILNFKLALILSLLTLISQNGIAHTEKVICRIKEIPCMHA